MLDSTGRTGYVRVDCLFCYESVSLRICTPEYGHDGQPLGDIGSCFERHLSDLDKLEWEKFSEGNLFILEPDYTKHRRGHLRIKTSKLIHNHGEAYFYNQPTVPKFGLGPNLTVWLCTHCCRKDITDEAVRLDKIQTAMSKKFVTWKEYVTKTEPAFEQDAVKQWRRVQRATPKANAA